MKYVDWVEKVLRAVEKTRAGVGRSYLIGVREVAATLGLDPDGALEALVDAAHDLDRYGWIEFDSLHQIDITQEGRKVKVASLATSWHSMHDIWLDGRQLAFLRAVCELSEQQADDRAWLAEIHAYAAMDRLGWPRDDDDVAEFISSLGDAGLLDTSRVTMGGGWNIYPTYAGVVRATESEVSELHDLVRGLLPDWETANTEWKRELHLDSKDEKAEFIRDVLALANPQVTGDRHLLVGWDPKTREFTTPADPTVTADRIEDLLDEYTKPTLTVKVRRFTWNATGEALVIEVERDRRKLPYRVKRALAGEKRRVEVDEIYVRHGSHVVPASAAEIADLEAEASRARESRADQ